MISDEFEAGNRLTLLSVPVFHGCAEWLTLQQTFILSASAVV